jgi:hypothetical protein
MNLTLNLKCTNTQSNASSADEQSSKGQFDMKICFCKFIIESNMKAENSQKWPLFLRVTVLRTRVFQSNVLLRLRFSFLLERRVWNMNIHFATSTYVEMATTPVSIELSEEKLVQETPTSSHFLKGGN